MLITRCIFTAVVIGLLSAPALGVDYVATLDDPNMFGIGWHAAVTGPDMDHGSAWVSMRNEWEFLGTLQISSLFGVAALPPIDDWAWFGIKINRGDNTVGGFLDMYTQPGSDPLLSNDDSGHQRRIRTMPDVYDNYSEHLPGGMYDEDDWGWRSTDGRDPNGVPLRPDGTTSEPMEFWSPPHSGEAHHRPDLTELQNADYTDLWNNSGWPDGWPDANDATTWNYGLQKVDQINLFGGWSTAGTAGLDTFRWEMFNGDTYTMHFDAPAGVSASRIVPIPSASMMGLGLLGGMGLTSRRVRHRTASSFTAGPIRCASPGAIVCRERRR